MCSACAPFRIAVASSQSSAIHLRRVIACIHAPFRLCAQTLRGTLLRPPRCCLFWLDDPLLLLRGFLRGLLRGCFLGCFLSCHLPILPFRWFASSSATFVAVEECIDSCVVSVKKKTTMRWKKWQQFFWESGRLSSLPITKDDAREETPPSIPRWHRATHEQESLREGFF